MSENEWWGGALSYTCPDGPSPLRCAHTNTLEDGLLIVNSFLVHGNVKAIRIGGGDESGSRPGCR